MFRPLTLTILIMLAVIFFSSINGFSTNSDLINYPIRSFYHANLTHLLANGFSLFVLSFMEELIGWQNFLLAILFIWLLSSYILLGIHTFIPKTKAYTVGFSGVIFGLYVLYFSLLGNNNVVSIGGLILSIIPQLFVRGISFAGHLSGILAGIIFVMLFKPRTMLKTTKIKDNATIFGRHLTGGIF